MNDPVFRRTGAVRPAVELRLNVGGEPHGRTSDLPTSLANPPQASRPPFASSFLALPRISRWVVRMTQSGAVRIVTQSENLRSRRPDL